MKQYLKAATIPAVFWIVISLFVMATQGSYSILSEDFWLQIYPYTNDFWSHLLTGEVQEYSLQYGIGTKMIPTYIYYAINTTSFLTYILSAFMPTIWVGITVQSFNAAILSTGMLFYCRYKFGKDCKWNVVAAVAYAMTGSGVFFSVIATWMFSIGMFPVVMVMFEKLMASNNKDVKKIGCIYAFCLGFTIINNVLIGYITCIAIAVFFFTQKMNSLNDFFVKFKRIAIFSIAGAALATPIYISLLDFLQEVEGKMSKLTIYPDITTLFTNMLPATNVYEIDSFTTYTALPFLIGFIFYLSSKQTDKQEKKENLLRIGILVASLVIFPLQCAWNLFDSPDGLQGRFIFVVSFIIITGAVKYFHQEQEANKKGVIISIVTITLSVVFAIINNNFPSIILTIAVVVVTIFCLTHSKQNKIKAICYFEVFLNLFMCICTGGYTFASSKGLEYETDDFTRVYYNLELHNQYESGLNNIYTYNTLCNKNARDVFWKFFAEPGNADYSVSHEENQVALSTMGLKYEIADEPIDVDYFIKKQTIENTTIYEYKNDLSIGYIVPEEIMTLDINLPLQTFLNEYVKTTSNAIKDYQSSFSNFSYSTKQNGKIFETIITTNEDADNIIYSCLNDKGGILKSKPITGVKTGHQTTIITDYEVKNVIANKFDINVFNEWYNDISKEQLYNINWDHDTFTGEINSSQDNALLMVTIGYSKNFKAYIDDKEVEIIPLLNNTFIGLKTPQGNHQIKLVYHEKSLPVAAVVQVVVLLSLITIIITEKYRTRGMKQK